MSSSTAFPCACGGCQCSGQHACNRSFARFQGERLWIRQQCPLRRRPSSLLLRVPASVSTYFLPLGERAGDEVPWRAFARRRALSLLHFPPDFSPHQLVGRAARPALFSVRPPLATGRARRGERPDAPPAPRTPSGTPPRPRPPRPSASTNVAGPSLSGYPPSCFVCSSKSRCFGPLAAEFSHGKPGVVSATLEPVRLALRLNRNLPADAARHLNFWSSKRPLTLDVSRREHQGRRIATARGHGDDERNQDEHCDPGLGLHGDSIHTCHALSDHR